MIKVGQVVKINAGFFDVKWKEQIIRLRASGSLRDQDSIPVVGDYVDFKDDQLLVNIHERKNILIRPKVANVDQVAIVVSLNEPKFSSFLLDKFLAIIEFQKIQTLIIFTKSDLGDHQPYYDYLSQQFKCLLLNNIDQKMKWDEILEHFRGKLTVLTGQTGVGKTSTLNNLLKKKEKTDIISHALGRGKHTTRIVEIFEHNGIEIIDTPGFSSLEIKLTKNELAQSYFDFQEWIKFCKFTTCLHYKEEDCYVKKMYNENKLLKSRYENYIKMLLEIK